MSQMMSAGDLDRTVSLMTVDQTQDAFGQPTRTPTIYKTVRAQRARLYANDLQRAQLLSEVAEAKYLTRYHASVSTGMMLREGTQDYTIISVEEIGRKEGLVIVCKVAR